METRIKKLITSYDRKLIECDKLLSNIESRKKSAKAAHDAKEIDLLNNAKKLISSNRQIYVQSKVDIDSLLDF